MKKHNNSYKASGEQMKRDALNKAHEEEMYQAVKQSIKEGEEHAKQYN